jgi:hypothetical protein
MFSVFRYYFWVLIKHIIFEAGKGEFMAPLDYAAFEVITPDGIIGKYLSLDEYTGKVTVLISSNKAPVEYDIDKCIFI